MHKPLALIAALALALPCAADTVQHSPSQIKMMQAKADPTALRDLVTRLSYERHRNNPKALERARTEIETALEQAGWPAKRESFTSSGVPGVNLRARRPGVGKLPRTWIIGAHYDTVPGSPGADDNASGVAGLIEIARMFGNTPFADTIELVAFDLEESLHGGSESLALNHSQDKVKVEGMISLEMLGFKTSDPGSQHLPALLAKARPALVAELERRDHRGDFIAAIGNAGGHLWFDLLVREINSAGTAVVPIDVQGPLLTEPALRRSDHAPFWDAGFRAVVLTDTAEHRNLRYHTSADTPETLDYEFMAGVVTGVARAIGFMAGPR